MIPITKNIAVADLWGKTYEPTYLRRAKGLVKSGRARWVDENAICLTHPPDCHSEDEKMSDIYDERKRYDNNGNVINSADTLEAVQIEMPEIVNEAYIDRQINKILSETAYIRDALASLEQIDSNAPNNQLGAQAKAQAIQGIVAAREKTNQQMLSLLEKLYDRAHPAPLATSDNNRTEMIGNFTAVCDTLRKVTDAGGNIPEEILDTIRGISDKLFS